MTYGPLQLHQDKMSTSFTVQQVLTITDSTVTESTSEVIKQAMKITAAPSTAIERTGTLFSIIIVICIYR